jgi:oxygen-independent coproporphyrinogen-3 oxidase
MTSLRLIEGCDMNYISQRFGNDKSTSLKTEAASFENKGLLMTQNDHLILTRAGKLFADTIASDLFF